MSTQQIVHTTNRGAIELTAAHLAVIAHLQVLWKNDGHPLTFTIGEFTLFSRHLYGDDEAGDRNLNLGSATFTVCRCNLSPGYSPILPFVIPRNVDEPPKMPPKEIPRRRVLRRLTVVGKRSLHHVTTFISSFQKMRTARLKCTEDLGLVLLSRNEGERMNCACIAKGQGNRSMNKLFYIRRHLKGFEIIGVIFDTQWSF